MKITTTQKVAIFHIKEIKQHEKWPSVVVEVTNLMDPDYPQKPVEMVERDSLELTGTVTLQGSLWEFVKAMVLRRPIETILVKM